MLGLALVIVAGSLCASPFWFYLARKGVSFGPDAAAMIIAPVTWMLLAYLQMHLFHVVSEGEFVGFFAVVGSVVLLSVLRAIDCIDRRAPRIGEITTFLLPVLLAVSLRLGAIAMRWNESL